MSATLGRIADTVPFSCVDGPGNRFVVFLQGCNFDCVACHNPQTIDRRGGSLTTVAELLARIRRASPFISGVTVSGGEATQQWRFVKELFTAIGHDPALSHLTRFVDTNGSAGRQVWDELAPVTDGVMVDLKCLDPAVHLALTTRVNDRVLDGIRHLAGRGLLYEVRLLLIDGLDDDLELLRATAAWLAAIDPQLRVKLIAFRPHGVREGSVRLATPSVGTMDAARDVFAGAARFDVCVV